jgi:lambda repressor-like predicted transcriptional regulator
MQGTLEIEKGVRSKLDGNFMVSRQFAELLCAYRECSAEVQKVIESMAQIVSDPDAEEDERAAAVDTIAEALFPRCINGAPGLDLQEEAEVLSSHDSMKKVLQEMDQEEATFVDRVATLMKEKGLTQADLAAAIEVGQSAVSMMLTRKCRPQRRTVERLAKALGVTPEEIWPTRKE